MQRRLIYRHLFLPISCEMTWQSQPGAEAGSQLPRVPAVSGRQALALLLGLGASGETEAYLPDKVLSSAKERYLWHFRCDILGLREKMLWPGCGSALTGCNIQRLGQVFRDVCQTSRCPVTSSSVHPWDTSRMCLVTRGQLNLFSPPYFHLIPPILRVHRAIASGISAPRLQKVIQDLPTGSTKSN